MNGIFFIYKKICLVYIMSVLLKRLAVATVFFLLLDAVYITLTKKLFQDQIINIQRVVMTVKPIGAILCYLFLIAGLYYFILQNKKPVEDAVILGLVIYGVYETTNYATLKKWSPWIAIMDTLWGGTLFGLTTYFTYALI